MPTQEERLATLERKVAAMELQRLYGQGPIPFKGMGLQSGTGLPPGNMRG